MERRVVITGVGMVTPLGNSPDDVLDRIARGMSAVHAPGFETSQLSCPACATIDGFRPEDFLDDTKSIRLMSRDAQLAVAAARLALADAALTVGGTYPSEDIALYGATGLTGMPPGEIASLVRYSAGPDGELDLARFGRVTLRRVRPVLSFRILANMPICFVSIFSGIRGENAVYTPWEGEGARAIVSGVEAVREGRAACALVGGCDVRTHEFAFVSLQQLGAFASWDRHGAGTVPGEGAAFLVLEDEEAAHARGARVIARIASHAMGTATPSRDLSGLFAELVGRVRPDGLAGLVAAGDGDRGLDEAETHALADVSPAPSERVHPKRHLGNTFAAAAAVQTALGATLARRAGRDRRVLVDCFGHGSQHGVFLLEGT